MYALQNRWHKVAFNVYTPDGSAVIEGRVFVSPNSKDHDFELETLRGVTVTSLDAHIFKEFKRMALSQLGIS